MSEPPITPVAKRLDGKVALIFGAGSVAPGWGIGRAIAVLFARHGARVIAVDIDPKGAAETAAIIAREGGTGEAVAANVAVEADVERAVSVAVKSFGRIDVLVNNVGIGRAGNPFEGPDAEWSRIAAANVEGPYLACKHVIPHMERVGGGSIVSTSSVAALRYLGYPHLAYGTTKAALLQMSRLLAVEYAPRNIRFNCVVPGLIDTPRIAQTVAHMYDAADLAEAKNVRAAQAPMGRMGDGWDVAHAALYLASDESAYVTATEIVVDGGLIAKFA